MKKSDIRILIVEDDFTLGQGIYQALKRQGYDAHWVTQADKAKSTFKLHTFALAIVDCMIPKVNGVELATDLRKEASDDFKILLTSGVFRDPHFMRNAVAQTRASGFLQKPFDITHLIKEVNALFEGQVQSEREVLFDLLLNPKLRAQEFISKIAVMESIHGYDLAFVYPTLMRTQVTGKLFVQGNDGSSSAVHFHNGRVVQVELSDSESYFGVLLVEKGFTTVEEVEAGLAMPSAKRIGERLVDANFLSPHAINIVQAEQMAIRLSKTIKDESVSLRLEECHIEASDAFIDGLHLKPILSDWVLSKMTARWLGSFYLAWMDSLVSPGPEFSRVHLSRHVPVLELVPDILPHLQENLTLRQLMEQSHAHEDLVFAAIHYLFLTGTIVIEANIKDEQDFEAQLKRLAKIHADMPGKNHFEVMGLSPSARPSEVLRAYHDLAKALHPDRLSPQAPSPLKSVRTEVFRRISEAYDVLKDDNRRLNYLKTLELGRAEEQLAAEMLFENAKERLLKGFTKEALKILDNLAASKFKNSELGIYHSWARLKMKAKEDQREKILKVVERTLHTVPPEDRHSPHFFYVKGLFNKRAGNLGKALQYFRHAATMDRDFYEAKREYVSLYRKMKTMRDRTIISDVTHIFKKARS